MNSQTILTTVAVVLVLPVILVGALAGRGSWGKKAVNIANGIYVPYWALACFVIASALTLALALRLDTI